MDILKEKEKFVKWGKGFAAALCIQQRHSSLQGKAGCRSSRFYRSARCLRNNLFSNILSKDGEPSTAAT